MTIDEPGALDLADIDFESQPIPEGWEPELTDDDPDPGDVRDEDVNADD